MDIESFRQYCLQKKHCTEHFPFDNRTLVFKVMGKMFALCDVENFESINLKCRPDLAIELREQYEGIIPGYHMHKKHWNTILLHTDVPVKRMYELIDHSYEEVVKNLPRKQQKMLL